MNKTFVFFLLLNLLLACAIPNTSSVNIHTDATFQVGNENYKMNTTLCFHQILVNASNICFNYTGFYFVGVNQTNVTICYIDDDFNTANAGSLVIQYYANNSGGLVWMNMSGLRPNTNYTIRSNSVVLINTSSDSYGLLSFNNTAWSNKMFQVFVKDTSYTPSPSPTINRDNLIWYRGQYDYDDIPEGYSNTSAISTKKETTTVNLTGDTVIIISFIIVTIIIFMVYRKRKEYFE